MAVLCTQSAAEQPEVRNCTHTLHPFGSRCCLNFSDQVFFNVHPSGGLDKSGTTLGWPASLAAELACPQRDLWYTKEDPCHNLQAVLATMSGLDLVSRTICPSWLCWRCIYRVDNRDMIEQWLLDLSAALSLSHKSTYTGSQQGTCCKSLQVKMPPVATGEHCVETMGVCYCCN